jgi:MFS transporter, MCT family, solute carrier family 16 (monocarboxylic acid transporters), member 10
LKGVNTNFSFYLVAIINVCSAFGRLTSAWLATKFGPINILIPFTAAAGVVTYIWPFVDSTAAFVVISVIYGLVFVRSPYHSASFPDVTN